MSQITSHILDISKGKPASGIPVTLEAESGNVWTEIGSDSTDVNGRAKSLLSTKTKLSAGNYRLKFETKGYFKKENIDTFYPYVTIVFQITHESNYHVPLLISPFGYSTYRGS